MAQDDNPEYKKRQTAHKIRISQILSGSAAKENDSMNFIQTSTGLVSRVNVSGFIVAKEASNFFSGFVIDDGSGQIPVRSFEKRDIENFAVGNAVNIVGKLRVYEGQRYILLEIITKTDAVWLEHRKKETELLEKLFQKHIPSKIAEPAENKEEFVEEKEPEANKIIDIIRNLDSGNGAEVSDVIKNSHSSGCEKIIENLLKNGDVFEIMPGRIKILE